jgi:hypothetical protein
MHHHPDRCYTCRARKAQARIEFWRDVTDFAGMAVGVLLLVAIAIVFGG